MPAGEGLPDFETLLRLYHKRVYGLICRLIGNNLDEAADLTQETFVKAYRAYPRFQGAESALYPWLCRIAVNSCKNRFREIGRRNRYEVRSLDGPVDSRYDELIPEVSQSGADVTGILERRELGAKIQQAIQALPPRYRIVIVLRDMHGLSYKEIAGAVGLTVETVKVRLFRARQVLRRRLAPYLTD